MNFYLIIGLHYICILSIKHYTFCIAQFSENKLQVLNVSELWANNLFPSCLQKTKDSDGANRQNEQTTVACWMRKAQQDTDWGVVGRLFRTGRQIKPLLGVKYNTEGARSGEWPVKIWGKTFSRFSRQRPYTGVGGDSMNGELHKMKSEK